MGNRSNLDQWAAMERMRFIERCAWWRGTVNRQDLSKIFGLSMAQASADLQMYQQENPGALAYNLNRKRYEGTEAMTPKFTAPVLEEAMALFLDGGSGALPLAALSALGSGSGSASASSQVRIVRMPGRRALPHVERRLFIAVLRGFRVRVKYFSVNSGKDDWRWLLPSAFVHDGDRWHVRAWCEQRNGWADFNLSRMADAEWPATEMSPPEPDEASTAAATLHIVPHHDLPPLSRKAVELDFGMQNGSLDITVPEALSRYLLARLHLPLPDAPPSLLRLSPSP